MKREQLAKVISELDDRHIADCVQYAPEGTAGSSERGRHMNVKRIVTLSLAAVLIRGKNLSCKSRSRTEGCAA